MSFIALIQGLQLLATLILVEEQICIESIKSSIRSLVSQHEDEFKAIRDIYNTLMTIHKQSVLSDSISKINDLLFLTWDVIAKDFNQKVELTKKITQHFKDVKVSKYDFTLNNGVALSYTTFAAISQVYSITSRMDSIAAKNPEAMMNNMKGAMIKEPIIVQKISVTEGQMGLKEGEIQISGGLTKPKGSILGTSEVQVSNSIQIALQSPSSISLWSKLKSFGSKVGKGLMGAFRCFGLLVMIYSIYLEQQQLVSLLQQLKDMNQQYGENGKFKIKQLEIINFVIICGQHFSNLAYASYACLRLMSNSYAMMALTFSGFTSELMEKSRQYSIQSTNINIGFCQTSNTFYKNLCKIDVHAQSSNNDMKNALQSVKNYLQDYLSNNKPVKTFDDLAKSIVRYSSESSVFVSNKLVKQTILTDFNHEIADIFIARKNQLERNKLSPEQQKIDQNYVINVINAYFRLVNNFKPDQDLKLIISYKSIDSLNQNQRKVIGGIVASYTNSIYSESTDGTQLFGVGLSTYKLTKTYGQIIDSSYSTPNTFPMIFETEEQKKKYIDDFRAQLLQQKDVDPLFQVYNGQKYSINQVIPAIYWKKIEKKLQVNGKNYDKMQFINQLIFKVKNIDDNIPHVITFNQVNNSWNGQLSY